MEESSIKAVGINRGIYAGRRWFGTTAEFWLNLQTRHDLALARLRVSPEAIGAAEAFVQTLVLA